MRLQVAAGTEAGQVTLAAMAASILALPVASGSRAAANTCSRAGYRLSNISKSACHRYLRARLEFGPNSTTCATALGSPSAATPADAWVDVDANAMTAAAVAAKAASLPVDDVARIAADAADRGRERRSRTTCKGG